MRRRHVTKRTSTGGARRSCLVRQSNYYDGVLQIVQVLPTAAATSITPLRFSGSLAIVIMDAIENRHYRHSVFQSTLVVRSPVQAILSIEISSLKRGGLEPALASNRNDN
jgi:hypothetical protein